MSYDAIERAILEFAESRGQADGWEDVRQVPGYDERPYQAVAQRLYRSALITGVEAAASFGSVLTDHVLVGQITDKGRVRLAELRAAK